jgi:hypothetical protein
MAYFFTQHFLVKVLQWADKHRRSTLQLGPNPARGHSWRLDAHGERSPGAACSDRSRIQALTSDPDGIAEVVRF